MLKAKCALTWEWETPGATVVEWPPDFHAFFPGTPTSSYLRMWELEKESLWLKSGEEKSNPPEINSLSRDISIKRLTLQGKGLCLKAILKPDPSDPSEGKGIPLHSISLQPSCLTQGKKTQNHCEQETGLQGNRFQMLQSRKGGGGRGIKANHWRNTCEGHSPRHRLTKGLRVNQNIIGIHLSCPYHHPNRASV